MAFCDSSIFQWQSQAQLVPVWEEYPPPFSNDVIFFDTEADQTDNYRALLESEFIRYRPIYTEEEEEKAFPHLMPFFEVASRSEVPSEHPVPTARVKIEEKKRSVNVKTELRWQTSSFPRGGTSEVVPETIQVKKAKTKPTIPNPVPFQIRFSEFETPSSSKNSSSDATQEFYLEESVSQEESPEDESDGVDVSEEEGDVPRKRKSSLSEEGEKGNKDAQPKKRQRTSPEQLEILERVYEQERLPGLDLRKELAQKLKMTPRRVQVWFQNKRAKEKRMVAAHTEFSEYARSVTLKNV